MAWQTPKTNWATGDIPVADDFNRIEGNIQELQNTKETPAGAQAKVDTHAGSKQTHGISGGYYIAKTSRSDQLPAWNDIQGKPSTFTPSSHTHTPGQISPQGAGSGLDADTVDGKHASDFINGTKAYGNVTYTDSIAAGQTLTKNIALGGNYKHGIAVLKSSDFSPASIIVFFGTNNLKTLVAGFGRASYTTGDYYGGAWSRRFLGRVTSTNTDGYMVASDIKEVIVQEIYISGTNLRIDFKNLGTIARSLSVIIDWEVW